MNTVVQKHATKTVYEPNPHSKLVTGICIWSLIMSHKKAQELLHTITDK